MCPVTIGIGIRADPDRVTESISRYPHPEQIISYTSPEIAGDLPSHFRVVIDNSPGARMIADLAAGNLSGALRGTLASRDTLSALKKAFQVSELERVVLLETYSGKKFFLAPVGVDEGWTVSQKISLIEKGKKMAARLGLPDQAGLISGGRLSDTGRHPVVDRTLADAELISRLTGARHYEILIEDALKECGLIIAPDGITGNLIFRTLLFAGNGAAHGAPVVNISKIFVDTSRVNPDYTNALILAASLAE
jgi:putative methanogen marker protein 4